ncbi:PDZ domain-containing protein [Frigoriglobus tundricola]|uniref:PDZ domain-containing protein n=1 Tax=Frigoriglobus tundricola TaxID=2774151 RepID=A0A6M5YJX3_9BACT|nr:PDZ domain-containing protein [Frigoriglobus tundricola]QJW94359.1 hypothetical protein FTUN_1879 [Frigoriglobus tundricola]
MRHITTFMLVLVGCPVAASDVPPPRAKADVAALVRQLSSDDFVQREAATERLAALKADAVPTELLSALKSPDPEVRERAKRAVAAIRERIALSPLPRAERFARRGQIDLSVAATVRSDYKADAPRLWESAFKLGFRAVENSGMKGDRLPTCPALSKDFPTFHKSSPYVQFLRTDERYAPKGSVENYHRMILASGVSVSEAFYGLCVIVSHGHIDTKKHISQSLVLATGDVTSEFAINDSVVICDGDVRVNGKVTKSLIIARGSISIKGDVRASTLAAGKIVRHGTIPAPPILSPGITPDDREGDKFKLADFEQNIRVEVKEKQINPLGVAFFELRQIGLDVKAADGTVQVMGVAPGKSCEDAGLKVGDVILDVGGKKPADAESLRWLLRDALAVGDAAVKVRRGKEALVVTVSLPE